MSIGGLVLWHGSGSEIGGRVMFGLGAGILDLIVLVVLASRKNEDVKLPKFGMLVHQQYTMYSHFLLLVQLMKSAENVRRKKPAPDVEWLRRVQSSCSPTVLGDLSLELQLLLTWQGWKNSGDAVGFGQSAAEISRNPQLYSIVRF